MNYRSIGNSRQCRHIQLLTTCFNNLSKGHWIQVMIFLPSLVFSRSFAEVIISAQGKQDVDTQFMILLSVVFLDYMLIIVYLMGQISFVHAISITALQKLQNCLMSGSRGNWRWRKRFLRSCNPLKIEVSSGKFVDQLSPLVCLDFSLDITINLVLLRGSK